MEIGTRTVMDASTSNHNEEATNMNSSVKSMLASANAVIDTITVQQALKFHEESDVIFVDVRDASERAQFGAIPDAVHVPRGSLEFSVDPQMPGYNPIFDCGSSLIVYCATGGRSTLATKTLVDMGVANVAHIAGGFAAWKEAGGGIEELEEQSEWQMSE